MSLYREQLESWLKTIDVKADTVLDIGGSAYPVKGRVRSWDVREYVVADNNNEKGWHDKWREPDVHIDLNDCDAGDFMARMEDAGYIEYPDVVFMLEVAEYLYRPWLTAMFLNGITDVVYSSWPAIYPVHNPKGSDYLRYTKEGIIKLFNEWDFEIKEIVPRKATKGRKALQEFYSLEGMRAVKNDDCIYDIGYMVKAVKK